MTLKADVHCHPQSEMIVVAIGALHLRRLPDCLNVRMRPNVVDSRWAAAYPSRIGTMSILE
jgi:hypothetical protein